MGINEVTPTAVVRARVEHSLGVIVTEWYRAASASDPAASTTYYRVPSRANQHVYEVEVTANANGMTIQCNCQAGQHDRACWHAGAVQLVLDGEIEAKRPKPIYRPAPGIAAEALSGRPDAA